MRQCGADEDDLCSWRQVPVHIIDLLLETCSRRELTVGVKADTESHTGRASEQVHRCAREHPNPDPGSVQCQREQNSSVTPARTGLTDLSQEITSFRFKTRKIHCFCTKQGLSHEHLTVLVENSGHLTFVQHFISLIQNQHLDGPCP